MSSLDPFPWSNVPFPLVVTVGRAEPLVAAAEVALASTMTGVGLALATEAARPKAPAMNAVPFMMVDEDVKTEIC